MRVTVLGSGTSTGVPVPGCRCTICTSDNKRNHRLRTSIFIQSSDALTVDEPVPAESQEPTSILVDTSPDLRYQALRAGISKIDAVLYTHSHADHVFGIDDLRTFNFRRKDPLPVYASEETANELERMFAYAFHPDPSYQGGPPPRLSLNRIKPFEELQVGKLKVTPLPLLHGRMEVYGFRIGSFAYLTDCSEIPPASAERLSNLDVLILDGLRVRPHPTHFSHEQAVREVERLKPKQTYLTHLSHEIDHDQANAALKKMTALPVELAYDGLTIDLKM